MWNLGINEKIMSSLLLAKKLEGQGIISILGIYFWKILILLFMWDADVIRIIELIFLSLVKFAINWAFSFVVLLLSSSIISISGIPLSIKISL